MRLIFIKAYIIISCFFGTCNSFIRNSNRIIKSNNNIFIRNSYNILETCYSEDEDDKKIQYLLYDKMEFVNINNKDDKSLYILIWYNCEQCKKLLEDMESLNLKTLYINIELNMPLLYKDDEFIADELFDIYREIYKEI
jgi:hypothetical protein